MGNKKSLPRAVSMTMMLSEEGAKELAELQEGLRLSDAGAVLTTATALLLRITRLVKQGYGFHLVKITRNGELAAEQDAIPEVVMFEELEHLLPDLVPAPPEKEEAPKDKQIPGQMDLTDLGASV